MADKTEEKMKDSIEKSNDDIDEGKTSKVATAASSTGTSETNDETIAQRLYAMDMLMNVYQFPPDVSALALDTMGGDITAACNWILEQGLAPWSGANPCSNIQ